MGRHELRELRLGRSFGGVLRPPRGAVRPRVPRHPLASLLKTELVAAKGEREKAPIPARHPVGRGPFHKGGDGHRVRSGSRRGRQRQCACGRCRPPPPFTRDPHADSFYGAASPEAVARPRVRCRNSTFQRSSSIPLTLRSRTPQRTVPGCSEARTAGFAGPSGTRASPMFSSPRSRSTRAERRPLFTRAPTRDLQDRSRRAEVERRRHGRNRSLDNCPSRLDGPVPGGLGGNQRRCDLSEHGPRGECGPRRLNGSGRRRAITEVDRTALETLTRVRRTDLQEHEFGRQLTPINSLTSVSIASPRSIHPPPRLYACTPGRLWRSTKWRRDMERRKCRDLLGRTHSRRCVGTLCGQPGRGLEELRRRKDLDRHAASVGRATRRAVNLLRPNTSPRNRSTLRRFLREARSETRTLKA